MGEVNSPRAVRYVEEMSLISAIANAGGTTKIAHVQHIVIIRGSLTEPQVCVVEYKDVATGKVRDIALQPHDIVWVPKTPWERLDKLVNDIVGTFVRTVAANEGAQFASPTGGRVGTSINVGGSDTSGQ
jgi:protein involved in polysaccharide export with SLBB domain